MKTRRWSFVLFVAALCLAVAPAATGQDEPDDSAALRLYYTGNGLLNRGLYELAAEEYRTFLAEHAGHEKAPVARYGLAVCLYRLGQFEDVINELTPLRQDREFRYAAEVQMILGRAHLARDEHADAAASFQRVLERHGEHELADDAAALLTESLYLDGRHDEVGEPCRRLIAKWPESPFRERAELFWGLAEMARERYGEAAQRFADLRARFQDGEYADQAALLEAQCLHRTTPGRRAIDAYRHVINQAAERFVPDAMYGLAALLHEEKQVKAAGDVLDEMLGRFPAHELRRAAVLLRGRVSFDLGQYDAARKQFRELEASLGTLRDDAAYWLAKCDLRTGQPEEAAQRLGAALKEFKETRLRAEMMFDRAVAQLRAGADDQAIKSAEQFIGQFAGHELEPDALQLIAAAHHQQQRYPDSLAVCRRFEAAHADHPLAAPVAFLAAENEFLDGHYRRASVAYESFIDRYPNDAQAEKAHFRLGMTRYHLGEFDAARDLLAAVARRAADEPAFRPALLALGDGSFQAGEWMEAEEHLQAYLAFGLDQPSADDALLKLGLARQRQEKLGPALESYDTLLGAFNDSPHRVRATFEKGQVLIAMERPDEAAVAFKAVVLADDAGDLKPYALNHLGVIAMQAGDHDDAAKAFRLAAESSPDEDLSASALFRQGRALLSAARYDDAAATFADYHARAPEGERVAEAAAYRAMALSRNGQAEEALAQIAAIEKDGFGALPEALAVSVAYEKAWCLRSLERAEDAMAAYRVVLDAPARTDGLRTHALLELAELEMDAERYGAAGELLDELLATVNADGDDADLRERGLYRRGLCAYRLKEDAVAAELLDSFIKSYPESDQVASASLLAGEALFRTGDHQRAVRHLGRVVKDFPEDESCGPALLRLGECQAKLQKWSESEKAFRAYLDRFAKSELWFQAQFGIGWARENLQRHSEAIDAYRRVVDRHQGETAARAQFQIGECLFAQKRYEEAIRELLKVDILYAYPEWSAAAVYEAGRCFEELGQPAEARKQFRQVQDGFGETKWAKLATKRLDELAQPALPGR